MENTEYSFQVIVGNISSVYDGTDAAVADRIYSEYVDLSRSGVGRAGGESVMLLVDGEPEREYGSHAPHFPES